jgi:hypothetical protein
MKLPFAVFTAREGYAWQSGLSAGLAKLDAFRRAIGKMPETDYGEPMTAGIATAGDEAIVWRFMREEKADNRGRDALYLALTFFPRTQAADIDVEALLATPPFSATVRNPPDEVDCPAGPSRMTETIGRDGIFAPDGSLAAAGAAVAQVPAGTGLKIWREEPIGLHPPRGPARFRLIPVSGSVPEKVSRAGETTPVSGTQPQVARGGHATQHLIPRVLRSKPEPTAPSPFRIPLFPVAMCVAILVTIGVSIGIFCLRARKKSTKPPKTEQLATQGEAGTPTATAEKAQTVAAKSQDTAEDHGGMVETSEELAEFGVQPTENHEKASENTGSPQKSDETTSGMSPSPQTNELIQEPGSSEPDNSNESPDGNGDDFFADGVKGPDENDQAMTNTEKETHKDFKASGEERAQQKKQPSVAPQTAFKRMKNAFQTMESAHLKAEEQKMRAEENGQLFDSASWMQAEALHMEGEEAREKAGIMAKKRDETAYVEACHEAFDCFRKARTFYLKAAMESSETNQP